MVISKAVIGHVSRQISVLVDRLSNNYEEKQIKKIFVEAVEEAYNQIANRENKHDYKSKTGVGTRGF